MVEQLEQKPNLRRMMDVNEMVDYLKQKNIKFDKMSEEDAEKYLRNNNNYYNVTAYKHNFERCLYIKKYCKIKKCSCS